MSDTTSEQVDAWTFPAMEMHADVIEPTMLLPMPEKQVEEQNEKKEIEEALNKFNLMKEEVETIKHEYQTKMNLLNRLIGTFENPLALIDNELMDIIQYIIKKSIKHLVYKELKADPKIVGKIIKELSELIHSQDGLITVFLSEIDYQRLNAEDHHPNRIYKINSSFQEGDIAIQSNHSEIKAILNTRINQILGIKYA